MNTKLAYRGGFLWTGFICLVSVLSIGLSFEAAVAENWETLVRAAQKEGKLFLAGPTGDRRRRALTETFEKKFNIQVEYLGTGGPELPPRVKIERRVGKYLWDAFIAGTTTLLRGIKPEGILTPIEPALVLPEVTNPKNWHGGRLPYMDEDRTVLAILMQAGQYVYVNTKMVNPEEFTSWRALLDPKWKGKIVVARDPRVAGYGRFTFQYFYINSDLGPDFIRELVKQDLHLMRNSRTGALWLARGKYAICMCSDIQTGRLMEEGFPIAVLNPHRIKEGTGVTSAYANLALPNRPPHPNAAKVFANWILTKEGSTLFSKATGMPSRRVDVTTNHIESWRVPKDGWVMTGTEDKLKIHDAMVPFLEKLLAK